MNTVTPPNLQLEILAPNPGGLGQKTSAELIAELTPAKRAELEAREAAAREKLAAKRKAEQEVKETASSLPSAVLDQETKAITYFKKNKEADYLQVVEQVKKLRAEGEITYEDLGGGKYTVTMPCGSKKVKMNFPADTKLTDSSYNYTDFDGKEISKKETTIRSLISIESQRYLEKKRKEGQIILSEWDFKTLLSSLLPDGNQEKQILAFMLATGFYGWMWLKHETLDRAVICSPFSDGREFKFITYQLREFSLIHSTFVE